MNKFTEEPLLKSLNESNFVTLFHDETTDVSNHSEATVFAMFSHADVHREHFLGIIHMTEGLTAFDHYTATLNLCKSEGLDVAKVQFVDLDGCNTNAGDMQGLKLYFRYHNPHSLHQTCNSHTLALIPKHKITESRFSLKVYIVLASLIDKAPIEVVCEGLEVSTNAIIMISTSWMANQLPFYAKIQTFFIQTFLDKDLSQVLRSGLQNQGNK